MTTNGSLPNGANVAAPATNEAVDTTTSENSITADEIALYDRQIRLWGVDAQEKILNANVLLINLRALATEVAKNLVLAGIRSLTIVDDAIVTEEDLGSQFFLTEAAIGMNRAEVAAPQIRNLNPRVDIRIDTSDISSKPPAFFKDFTIVIATDVAPNALDIINTATRVNNVPFYAASLQGFYGFIFVDLISHTFVIQRDASNMPTRIGTETRTRAVISSANKKEGDKNVEMVTKRERYSTWMLASGLAPLAPEITKSARRKRAVSPLLSCFRSLWEFQESHGGAYPSPMSKEDLTAFTRLAQNIHNRLGLPAETLKADKLRTFLSNLGSEIAPVAAVIGGQLAQDVINVLGQKQQPIQNFVLFDGMESEAHVYALHPEGELGEGLLPVSEAVMNGNAGDAIMLD